MSLLDTLRKKRLVELFFPKDEQVKAVNIENIYAKTMIKLCRRRQLVGPLTTSILFILIAVITIIGGVGFVVIEANSSQIHHAPHRLCLEKIRWKIKKENMSWTDEQAVTKTLLLADECLTRESRIDNMMTGFMFVWSVYTTVGYGDTFPHTTMGRLMTIIYATIAIPLYIALKVEFGQLVSSSFLKVATATEKWWCTWRMGKYSTYPSNLFIFGISLCCAIIYLCITTIVVSCVEGWSLSTTFYYTFVTVHLIGLGDVISRQKIVFLLCQFPLLLMGDTFTSHINFYLQNRFRVGAQYLSLLACGNVTERSIPFKDDSKLVESEFPPVSTTFMPLEFVRDEQLKSTLLTPNITTSATKLTTSPTLSQNTKTPISPSLL